MGRDIQQTMCAVQAGRAGRLISCAILQARRTKLTPYREQRASCVLFRSRVRELSEHRSSPEAIGQFPGERVKWREGGSALPEAKFSDGCLAGPEVRCRKRYAILGHIHTDCPYAKFEIEQQEKEATINYPSNRQGPRGPIRGAHGSTAKNSQIGRAHV